MKIRVLIIDDSRIIRAVLTQGISSDPLIEVVGSAQDPFEARDKIIQLKPDVITLDVEMPKMDGVTFLQKLMPQYPLPTVMVSGLTATGTETTLKALEAGAVDFINKPGPGESKVKMIKDLIEKIKIASTVDVSHLKYKKPIVHKPVQLDQNLKPKNENMMIGIGASTGGTEALKKIVSIFPKNTPGIVIVQHMPPKFTTMFAERLNKICNMEVKEAKTGDKIRSGLILLAPGGKQMEIKKAGGIYEVICEQTELVSGHCPSVDVLFHSMASIPIIIFSFFGFKF